MGRALVRNPQVFLFDEPLSNLDAKLRVDMRTEIKQLHLNLGTTIVYVTHDQVEAMTLATVIAVLRDGEIQQFGTPAEIYNRPANIFVADFMGSPSMNLVPVEVLRVERRHGGVARTRRRRAGAPAGGEREPGAAGEGGREGDPRHPSGSGHRRRRRGPACAQRRAGRLHRRGGRAGRLRHLCRRASRRPRFRRAHALRRRRSRRRARRSSPSTWTGRASSTRKRNSGSTDERDEARTDGDASVGRVLRARRGSRASR